MIDQSSSSESGQALDDAALLRRPLRYFRSTSVGKSRALNEAVSRANGEVLAFTDDDCLVPPEWGAEIVRLFRSSPRMAVLYGAVRAQAEPHGGWIPEFAPLRKGFVPLAPELVPRGLGIGANLAARRSSLASIGPFDEFLGVGGVFGAAEDTDIGYRALRGGLGVYATETPAVRHCGLRRGAESVDTASRYLRGFAAMLVKHVRCGDAEMLAPLWRELSALLRTGTRSLVSTGRPSGYRRALRILEGIAGSFRYGVDRRWRVYRPWH